MRLIRIQIRDTMQPALVQAEGAEPQKDGMASLEEKRVGSGEIVELRLDSIAYGGQSVGRLEGKVTFVAGALPGEVVRARIVKDRKRWSRAEMIEVLVPSAQRVAPPCPHFGSCGGCQWQHVRYQAQLEYKRQIVVEQLQRLGRIEQPPVRPARGMAEPWAYRNHAQFSVDESGRLGFLASRGHAVIPVERCLILHSLLDEIYAAFDLDWPELRRLSLRGGIHTGERMCVFEAADDQVPMLEVDMPLSCVLRLGNGTDIALTGPGLYHETLRGTRFRISAGSFFQVNTAQTEVLLDVVQEYLQPDQDDVLLDVYCGVGTLGLSFRATVGRVIGIEESRTAIADARANADGAEDVTLLEGKARTVLPTLREDVSHVVLDPPRQGCHPVVLQALLGLAPRRIVYVSCDPSTLGRDALVLAEGGYELVEVQPVDMFPQTYHIETVSVWQRRGAER